DGVDAHEAYLILERFQQGRDGGFRLRAELEEGMGGVDANLWGLILQGGTELRYRPFRILGHLRQRPGRLLPNLHLVVLERPGPIAKRLAFCKRFSVYQSNQATPARWITNQDSRQHQDRDKRPDGQSLLHAALRSWNSAWLPNVQRTCSRGSKRRP